MKISKPYRYKRFSSSCKIWKFPTLSPQWHKPDYFLHEFMSWINTISLNRLIRRNWWLRQNRIYRNVITLLFMLFFFTFFLSNFTCGNSNFPVSSEDLKWYFHVRWHRVIEFPEYSKLNKKEMVLVLRTHLPTRNTGFF